MIRIETTAAFDADGTFIGRMVKPVPPGEHKVIVEVDESDPPDGLRKDGNIWVLDCVASETVEEVQRRLDEESMRRILEGPFE